MFILQGFYVYLWQGICVRDESEQIRAGPWRECWYEGRDCNVEHVGIEFSAQ